VADVSKPMDPPKLRHPEPLTHTELQPLWRRERQTSWLQIAAMACFLLGGAIAQRAGSLAYLGHPVLAGAVLLLVAATVLQMRTRCPRCRTRLSGKILRILPDKCPRCGVVFPRQPSANG
jgi:hypothetical protein